MGYGWKIYGKVYDAITNEPINDVTVALATPYASPSVTIRKADKNGYYEFTGVLGGGAYHTIAATKSGYVSSNEKPSVVQFIIDAPRGEKEINLWLIPHVDKSIDGILMGGWDIGKPCEYPIYNTIFLSSIYPYFEKWCDNTNRVIVPETQDSVDCRSVHPTLPIITNTDFLQRLSNPNLKMLAIHAHGADHNFSSIWAGDVAAVMVSREPIPLVLSCSCGFMEHPDSPNSVSYQLRKGQTEGTFIIGIKDTVSGSMFSFAELFLDNIDKNRDKRFEDAFNETVALNPSLYDNVVWRGDTNLTLNEILEAHDTELTIDIRDADGNPITEAYVGDTVYVVGTLRDAETGELLQNAEIHLYKDGTNTGLSDKTDERGEYSIPYTVVEADYPSVTFKTRFEGARGE